MIKKKLLNRITAVCLSVFLLSGGSQIGFASAEDSTVKADYTQSNLWELPSYQTWLTAYAQTSKPDTVLRKNGADFIGVSSVTTVSGKDSQYAVSTAENTVSYTIQAENSGLYTVHIGYRIKAESDLHVSKIERTLLVNGSVPYRECSYLEFSRIYRYTDVKIPTDNDGNDIQPAQAECEDLTTYTLSDSTGYNAGALYIYLQKGENTVSLKGVRGEFQIAWIELSNPSAPVSYQEYLTQNNVLVDNAQKPVSLEAENIYQKSDSTISLTSDRTSVFTSPVSAEHTRLNCIGGSSWSTVGQWISWQVDVKQSGYYKIAARFKQDVYPGAISSRKLTIDDKLPFAEASNIAFEYRNNWQSDVLKSGGTELKFYLTAGTHTIKLEAVLGDMTDILESISTSLTTLNNNFLRILVYTGSTPDIYRDYGFDRLIPDVIVNLNDEAKSLEKTSKMIKTLSKSMGDNTVVLDKTVDVLKRMGADSDAIAPNLLVFKDDLTSLGSWLNTYTAQPLLLDELSVLPANQIYVPKKETLIQNFLFGLKLFVQSFKSDYEPKENSSNTPVQVWIASGQDQSKIIRRLVNDSFTPKTGLSASVKLVSGDALLPNVLAGTRVDVYLGCATTEPINYAIRGAVIDLAQFSDFKQVASAFHPISLVPFTYKGKTYAMPESMDFPLLFYRKDVFSRLNLSVPKTWDDFYETISILQKNNMTVGADWLTMFSLLLYQSGGNFYNSYYTASGLDTTVSLSAFKKTLQLYKLYGLPVEFNFSNRFRSGEMPMGIVPYTTYNQLTIFAPEIKGNWGFAPVPGTVSADGKTINNTSLTSGSGAVMLKTVTNKHNAWEYLKWWVSADTQSQYGIAMETIMGTAARQSSANLQVVSTLPWSADEYKVIKSQWDQLSAVPQIPGSYYMTRTLDFSFNSAYALGEDSAESLLNNVLMLNGEIDRKLKEFADKG